MWRFARPGLRRGSALLWPGDQHVGLPLVPPGTLSRAVDLSSRLVRSESAGSRHRIAQSKEVEPLGTPREAHDPGLLRVQSQPDRVQHRCDQFAGLLGLLSGGAQGDEIICVLHQHPQPLPARLPRLIEHVQSDVCE